MAGPITIRGDAIAVSAAYKAAVFAQETAEAFIWLLTIDHDDLDDPISLCNDQVDTVSNGVTFFAFPFEFTPPAMAGDKPIQAQIKIGNVSRIIIEEIRRLSSSPTMSVQFVMASDPDTIEASWPDFYLNDVSYDQTAIFGTLVVETLGNEPFPADSFMPSNFPGLFGGAI